MSTSVKEAMRELVETSPEECIWDEVLYRVYMRRGIAAGLSDVVAGRDIHHKEVFAELLGSFHQVDDGSAWPERSTHGR